MKYNKLLLEILRFFVCSGLGAIIGYVTYRILDERLAINYIIAAFVANLLAYTFGFIAQKYWAFKDDGEIKKQSFVFIWTSIIFLAANPVFMYGFVHYLHFSGINSLIITAIIFFVGSYLTSKKLIFNKTKLNSV